MGKPLSPSAKVPVAFSLTATAGFVDVVGYLILHSIYTANMTGNLISVGIGWVHDDVEKVLRGGLVVAEFIAGALIGRFVLRRVEKAGFGPAASASLGLELLLLAVFTLLASSPTTGIALLSPGSTDFYLLAALPALAMGVQNVTVRRVGPLTFYTTHVTGTITRFAEALADAAAWDRSAEERRKDLLKVAFTAGLIVTYFGGALSGAWLQTSHGPRALVAPMCMLAMIIALDLARPLVTPRVGRDWQPSTSTPE